MSDLANHLAFLRDPRLAALATSAAPAWLWSTDATRILWANPVGAAIFGLSSPALLAARRFDPRDQTAAQIARLRRLYDGTGLGVAVFAPDGSLLHATAEARARLGGPVTLAALGAERLGSDAAGAGHAEGDIPLGHVTIDRLGTDASTALAMTFVAAPAAAAQLLAPTAVAEPPRMPAEPPPEVEAPPTAPAAPVVPEAPPVAPDMPEGIADRPAAAPIDTPMAAAQTVPDAAPEEPEEDDSIAGAATTPHTADVPAGERRHPLRFVWQMDANERFTLGSDEFTEVIGPRVAVTLGRPWDEINDELALDPENQVARAVATRDTWSGITVSWPVDGIADRLKVELSGLPIYDRNRTFLGYRGFGVCRDVDRLAMLAVMRRSAHAGTQLRPAATTTPAGDGGAATGATLTVVPSAPNVVPFRTPAPAAEARSPALSPVERNAFHELARELTARLKGEGAQESSAEKATGEAAAEPGVAAQASPAEAAAAMPAPTQAPEPGRRQEPQQERQGERQEATSQRSLLDRIPVGVLVYRLDTLLYANRAFLEWTGYPHIHALAAAGGLDSLFVEGDTGTAAEAAESGDASKRLTIATARGDRRPVEARLFSIAWDGESALALMLMPTELDARLKAAETALHTAQTSLQASEARLAAAEAALQAAQASLQASEASLNTTQASLHETEASRQSHEASLRAAHASLQAAQQATERSLRLAEAQARELKTILDTATDGVVVIEPDGRIVSANRSAEALFGHSAAELATRRFADLFAPASRPAALEYLDAVARGGVGGLIHDGREFTGEVSQGGTIPLFMTLGRIAGDA